jgi:chloramphenicol 3-O phosphotransferase
MHEDAMIEARPRHHVVRDDGIAFAANGDVTVGPEFLRLEAAWRRGLASIAGAGARLILDEVFMDGATSQEILRRSLAGRKVAWIGVTCDADVAAQRERARGDRVVGQFERQSMRVHEGVHYDLVVDTSSRLPHEVAHEIAQYLCESTSL